MARTLAIELTMMCLIKNKQGQYLIQNRTKSDWPGWTFPGGHVEKDESILAATIREIKEETGLSVQPTLAGTAEWNNLTKETRELAFLFTAETNETIKKSSELFWVTKEELLTHQLAGTLTDLLPIFLGKLDSIYFEV